MDKHSELLIRAALHDMANVLAGVRGILDLTETGSPLSPRDRERLEAVVEEGAAMLGGARHLALGTLPEAQPQDREDWIAQLADELKPAGILFRCRFEFTCEGDPGPWPGAVLRNYVRAAVRQMLPYVSGGVLTIHCVADAAEWRLRFRPVSLFPEGLMAPTEEPPRNRPGSIAGRLVAHIGTSLGVSLSCEDDSLLLRVPRP